MKKAAVPALLLLLLLFLCAYTPNPDIHIRFGSPGGKGTLLARKGYVMNYHLHKKHPIWVSYHLNKSKLQDIKKVKALYLKDPLIAGRAQPVESDFNVRNYYKGRMAPLFDMMETPEILKSAQYITNIALRHDGLRRKWTELEDKIRGFALKGKDVWVITGPAYDREKGVKKSPKGMEIPTHFFKIAVFQNREYQFVAAAFLFENRSSDKPLGEYLVSIGEVERITGLKFLSAFPEAVQKNLKMKADEGSVLFL